MKGFLLLLSFMTRIPMPKIDYDEEKLGKSMKLFPLVGIVIGFILLFFSIVFSYVLSNLSFSAFLPIIILVVILTDLISTGALHLDGLADTFDGIFSYRSKHKMLEIMKDSRLGYSLFMSFFIPISTTFKSTPKVFVNIPIQAILFNIASETIGVYSIGQDDTPSSITPLSAETSI